MHTCSKIPISMVTIILNILEEAAKKAIFVKLVLISNDVQSEDLREELFTTEEIYRIKKKLKEENNLSAFYSSISIDEKFRFIFDIEQSIIALLNPAPILFAIFIALNILDEMNIEKIKTLANNYCSDNSFNHFLKNDFKIFNSNDTLEQKMKKKEINMQIAEHYLLAHANFSLMRINSTCDIQIKIDALKIPSKQFLSFGTIFLIYILIECVDESFITNIIEQIEQSVSEKGISNFFVLSILSLLSMKSTIYALYLSVSDLHSGWYQAIMKKLENIKNKENFDYYYNDIIAFTRKVLKNYEGLNDEAKHKEEVNKLKAKISNKIQKAISKIQKLPDLSILKSRGIMYRRIPINYLKDQAKEIEDIFSIPFGKNKCCYYLDLALSSINKAKTFFNVKEIMYRKIQKTTFIDYESIRDCTKLCIRASDELKTVAHLFKISNIEYDSDRLYNKFASKFNNRQITHFCVSVKTARIFNIVEMAPISSKLELFSENFDPSEGSNPNLKELMGLQSAVIHILTPKDEMRNRFKTEPFETYETDETDSYYSSDYFEGTKSISFRSIDFDEQNVLSFKKPVFNNQKNLIEKYKKLQMSNFQIAVARDELKLGNSNWTKDVWIAFLYCFNMRMESIGIQFNPNDDYKSIKYPISLTNGISVVLKFYPLASVTAFWKNKERIERFIGKYSKNAEQIIKAFIRGFDDADHIVTPLYMKRTTYQDRTLDTLALIYE
ncbi:hypothetical protein M9Y10_015616 [Tritrichomonas musculus]|uniref:Uncharacterized protein n=1 Tax=Tritrichomonas musculus TaxID=1915356 RepID=A0ABR2L2S1_9EUKA